MDESQIMMLMQKMSRKDLMLVLAAYLLEEKGIKNINEKQAKEVIEENFMENVAIKDLKIEIINSRHRLGFN